MHVSQTVLLSPATKPHIRKESRLGPSLHLQLGFWEKIHPNRSYHRSYHLHTRAYAPGRPLSTHNTTPRKGPSLHQPPPGLTVAAERASNVLNADRFSPLAAVSGGDRQPAVSR